MHEADEPDIITHLFDTHPLASEHDAEVDLSPVVTDAATAGDGGRPVVKRIVQLAQPLIGSRGPRIQLRRHLHPQGLMRPFLVEPLEEIIEAGLLLQEVGRGGLGRFGLQRQMHPLVPAVLLGMPGLDAFDADTEA